MMIATDTVIPFSLSEPWTVVIERFSSACFPSFFLSSRHAQAFFRPFVSAELALRSCAILFLLLMAQREWQHHCPLHRVRIALNFLPPFLLEGPNPNELR